MSEGAKIDIEMTVEMGRGYVTTESRDDNSHSIGDILLDAIFSPVVKVNYNVTAARVGEGQIMKDYARSLDKWNSFP